MAKVINIIGSGSNVGKTYVMEGTYKRIKKPWIKHCNYKA